MEISGLIIKKPVVVAAKPFTVRLKILLADESKEVSICVYGHMGVKLLTMLKQYSHGSFIGDFHRYQWWSKQASAMIEEKVFVASRYCQKSVHFPPLK